MTAGNVTKLFVAIQTTLAIAVAHAVDLFHEAALTLENEYFPIGSDPESDGLGVEGRTLIVTTATAPRITAR